VSRTTDIRRALVAAVAAIAPQAEAFSAGAKYAEGVESFALRIPLGDPEDEATIERLDAMLDDDGELSIRAALDADPTLGGAVNSLFVARHSGHRIFPTPAGPVLGAEWLVDVT
jgi:hypothetical protein